MRGGVWFEGSKVLPFYHTKRLRAILFVNCGRNDLRVTLSGDDSVVSQTDMTIYHDGSVYDSYTGIRSMLYSNVPSGDYYAKAEVLGYTWNSPTLHVGGKPLLGSREYYIEIYVYVTGVSGMTGEKSE